MPVNYWSILKRAFYITTQHPRLWLLGLFLAGGFNANFFYWANLRLSWRDNSNEIFEWVQRYLRSSHHAIIAAAVFILFAVAVIIVVNWAKTAFILYASDILKLPRFREKKSVPEAGVVIALAESRRFVSSIIVLSVFTMVSMALFSSIMGGTAKLLFDSRGLIWLIAGTVFVAMVFFFSCLNIFGSFFIIFYRKTFGDSLNLALDLMASRWRSIAEMAFLLSIIYALCFFGGTSLLFLLRFVVEGALLPLVRTGLFTGPVVLGLTTLMSGLLLWLWLAMVNTFFNISLLLLFVQIVRPLHHPELESSRTELPVPAAAPASSG
jgi:hypothetical protein